MFACRASATHTCSAAGRIWPAATHATLQPPMPAPPPDPGLACLQTDGEGWFKRNAQRFQTGRMGNFVNLVGGNKVVRVLTYGSRYDCHSVVQVSLTQPLH